MCPKDKGKHHVMPEEESDVSFANFGGSKRLYPAPSEIGDDQESPNPLIRVARREGFDASLRS